MPSFLTVLRTTSVKPAYLGSCPGAGFGWVWRRTCKGLRKEAKSISIDILNTFYIHLFNMRKGKAKVGG